MATVGDDCDGSRRQKHFAGDLDRSARGICGSRDLFVAAGQISEVEHHGFNTEPGCLQFCEFADMIGESQVCGEAGFGQTVQRVVNR